MKLRMTMVVGALTGLAWVGCTSGDKAPTATGKAVTAQVGTIEGRVTDVDDQTFTVQVPNGSQTTLHVSGRTGKVEVKKGDSVRATYQVDTSGNKIAQSVAPISPSQMAASTTPAAASPTGKALTAQAEQVEGQVTDTDKDSFTVQVPGGKSVKLKKTPQTQATALRKGDDVRASYRVDTSGNNVAQSVTVITAKSGGHTPGGVQGSQTP